MARLSLRGGRAYAPAMRKQVSQAALAAGVILLASAHGASAHSRMQFTEAATRCSSCHTGGTQPTASFEPGSNATQTGAGLHVIAGQAARLALDVKTVPGKGLGIAIAAAEGLTIESASDTTRVERQILGHRLTIPAPTGSFHLPFVVRGTATHCGRAVTLRASVAAVDRNNAPSGDGTATSAISVFVDCAGGAQPAEPAAAAHPDYAKPGTKPVAAASVAAPVASADAPRVAAPSRALTSRATVSVSSRRTADGAVQLGIFNEERMVESPAPGLVEFKAGMREAGEVHVYFAQGSGYVILDCTVGTDATSSSKDISVTIDAPPLHTESSVSVADGHAVAVVPRTGVQRNVDVKLMGKALKWSFRSCDLIPVR
jgi:hypothetical protein